VNVFVVQRDPLRAARDLCNKHVCKMLVESAQLLSNVLHLQGGHHPPYRPTHLSHPCTVWAAASPANAGWLREHAAALAWEYTLRYGKVHKTLSALQAIDRALDRGDWWDHTPFVQAMPDGYRQDDPVAAYRAYYVGEKARFARWAPRAQAPAWWPDPRA